MMSAASGPSGASNKLLVSEKQRGNPLLSSLRNVAWEIVPGSNPAPPGRGDNAGTGAGAVSTMIPDFIMSPTSCAFFLSLKWHLQHPTYIVKRLRELPRPSVFKLRVVLLLVDVNLPSTSDDLPALTSVAAAGSGSGSGAAASAPSGGPLAELSRLCFMQEATLLLAWSSLEVARYLETFKAYEGKGAGAGAGGGSGSGFSSIQEKVETSFLAQATRCLTAPNIPAVNRSDVGSLLTAFGTVRGLCAATETQLAMCPGVGDLKARRIHHALHAPFFKGGGSGTRTGGGGKRTVAGAGAGAGAGAVPVGGGSSSGGGGGGGGGGSEQQSKRARPDGEA